MNYLSILLEIKIILLTWGVLGRYLKKKTTKCCDFIRICSDYQNMTFKFIMGLCVFIDLNYTNIESM